jgi:diaminohydroxyphosphoribosylaminopyrimidine deaminase / 5-amino-6-(5-phosphoribosylamino)uracil reductase
MRRALELARRGLGSTEPNPAVGCVIVSAASGEGGGGKEEGGEGGEGGAAAAAAAVVGEGFHPRAGRPHAEVYALRAAGQKARGGTAYVTLEPCAHHGRTPPCARALIDAGVKRVRFPSFFLFQSRFSTSPPPRPFLSPKRGRD